MIKGFDIVYIIARVIFFLRVKIFYTSIYKGDNFTLIKRKDKIFLFSPDTLVITDFEQWLKNPEFYDAVKKIGLYDFYQRYLRDSKINSIIK